MAKKKEAVLTEEVKTEEVKPKVEEETVRETEKERFINRKLRVINGMSDRAKARRLAERVLMNNK